MELKANYITGENWVELEVWKGDRCVICIDVDDDLSMEEREEIAQEIVSRINQGE